MIIDEKQVGSKWQFALKFGHDKKYADVALVLLQKFVAKGLKKIYIRLSRLQLDFQTL